MSVQPEAAASPAEPDAKKRKHHDLEGSDSHPLDDAQAPDIGHDCGDDDACGLRFRKGDEVLCNVSKRQGFLWKRGKVKALNYKTECGQVVPYTVALEGSVCACPEDDDECIRLAARACLDSRIMRLFALTAAERLRIKLRFSEGDRVAVQLDRGNWEEGVVIEVWATGERNGKVLKTWKGLAVPYAVRLDLREVVMVPFDNDEVIRAESAERPPQKSIAELIGGKELKSASATASKRFEKREKLNHEWILVDTMTGRERPCNADEPP